MTCTATRLLSILVFVVLAAAPFVANAQPCQCQLPDNGSGTVTMPPACNDGYQGNMQIVTGLPGGTTIQIQAKLYNFVGVVESPGGLLGGTFSVFASATLEMLMTGTGSLAGFNRTIFMLLQPGQLDWGPRNPGDAIQVFPGDPRDLKADIFGDPDFDFLQFRSGTLNGYPGSGSSTLTRIGLPGSPFDVDSFFDIEYDIIFQGAPGSVLDGFGATHADLTRISVCGSPPVSTETGSWGAIKALYVE